MMKSAYRFSLLFTPEGMSSLEFILRLVKVIVLLFISFSLAADITPFFYQRF